MKLYLIQHGLANTEEIDPEKKLSPQGQTDVQKIARFMQNNRIDPGVIWHSGKARAEQTAQIIAGVCQPAQPATSIAGLQPQDSPLDIVPFLKVESGDIVLVGHLPHLNKLATFLLSNQEDGDTIAFREGSVLCLEKTDQIWRVNWMVTPDLLI